MKPRRQRFDMVAPTATAALDARRQAQKTLREIDALLDDDEPLSTGTRRLVNAGSESTSPGPSSYDPQKERTQWRHGAAVALHHRTLPPNKKTAVVRLESARATKTPGPGAYNVESEDRVVKPRVTSAAFLSVKTTPIADQDRSISLGLEPATADKWLSRFASTKGAVAYKPSSGPSGCSREQREKLRHIKIQKTRHCRVGFYNVRFELTEPRLGAKGIVPMDKSSSRTMGDSVRHTKAALRRHIRAWQPIRPASKETIKSETVSATRDVRKRTVTTIQWRRARAKALLERGAAHPNSRTLSGPSQPLDLGLPTRSLRRDLVAHALRKQCGRDAVRCRAKNRRVTIRFDAPPMRETKQQATEYLTGKPKSNPANTVVYAKMLGRDDATVDPDGIFLVGRSQNVDYTNGRLLHRPNEIAIRPRISTTTFRVSHSLRHDKPRSESVLSPKFMLVERRTKGHAFLRFENQLDRRERSKAKVFALDSHLLRDHEPLGPEAVRAAKRLKFPHRGIAEFSKLRGRDDS